MEIELYQDKCTGFQDIKYLTLNGIFIGIVEVKTCVPHFLNENLLLRCHIVHHFKKMFKQKQKFKKMKLSAALFFIFSYNQIAISTFLNIANRIQFQHLSPSFCIFRQCQLCNEIGQIGCALSDFNQIGFNGRGCNLCIKN